MKWLWFAYKNIMRNLRRSLITMLIIAVGTASVLITSGFILYIYDSLQEINVRDLGHVIIAHKDYFDKEEETPLQYGLADHKNLMQQIEQQNEEIDRVIPRLQFSGLITNGNKSVIFTGTGIEPEGEFYVKASTLKMLTGKILTTQSSDAITIPPNISLTSEDIAKKDKKIDKGLLLHNNLDNSSVEFDKAEKNVLSSVPQVMLTKDLAKQLNAKVNSLLTLLATTKEGVLNALDVRVQGIFTVGIPEIEKNLLLVTLSTAQELLITDKVSTLSIYLYETKNTATQLAALTQQYPKLAIQPWWKQAFLYFKIKVFYSSIFGIFGVMVFLIVFFAVTNTLSMMVIERTYEIGTLLALGTFPWQIIRNFILEALLIGIAGTLLGMLIAASVSISLFFLDIQMLTPFKQLDGYPLYIYMSSWLYGITTLSVIMLCIGAAWLTSRTAAGKPIVESLVHI